MLKSFKSFTLAETLITLAIIGVVAAISIPALMNKFQDQELKSRFLKAYSQASQAWRAAVAENPNTYTNNGGWTCLRPDGTNIDYGTDDGRIDAIKSQMKVIKSCSAQTGCWPDKYEFTDILGTTSNGALSPLKYGWINADGMCWSAPFYPGEQAHLIVDTNCNKSPNLIGEDIFSFLLGKDGIIYFAFDDKSQYGKPVASGGVCPRASNPYTVNGRSVDMKKWLTQ